MEGETDLNILLKSLKPSLNKGSYVFISVNDIRHISRDIILFEFKEKEGITIIIEQAKADELNFKYEVH